METLAVMRPIIVLGPERSGTSACAEMVAVWGAYAGEPDDLPRPDALNPRGRWEYKPLWDLLASVGGFETGTSWWEPSFADGVAAKAADSNLADRARALISKMEGTGRPWVWKDPALCHFLEFWRQLWTDPVFLIMVRHPIDIARSWQNFTAASCRLTSVGCNLLRWQHMVKLVLRNTDATDAKLFVEYEQLMAAPRWQARVVSAFLDAQCGTTTAAATVEQMVNVCQRELWRFRSVASERAELRDPQLALYQFQRGKCAGATAPFADVFAMPEGWWIRVIEEEMGSR